MKAAALAVPAILPFAAPARADEARENARTRKLMHDYARCVVKAHHEQAAEALLSDVDNGMIQKKYPDLIDGRCLGQVGGDGLQMRFGGDLYRYALADALVNADYARQESTDFSDRLPLAHLHADTAAELAAKLAGVKSPHRRAAIERQSRKDAAVAWLSQYGECVVRTDPVHARRWLLTPPDGPEEISRINELQPAFGSCLDQGTLKFNRITMRGTVAINYFRLASATPQPIAKVH